MIAGSSPLNMAFPIVNGAATGHLHIKALIPLKQRDKEKTEIHIGHKDLTLAGAATASAKNASCVVKQLPALTDTSDKQHIAVLLLKTNTL